MSEFYVAIRYRVPPAEACGDAVGGVIFPAGVALHTLQRRDFDDEHPHLQRRLLDPQLYLSGLDASACVKSCVNLASYGWFNVDGLAEYDSALMTQGEWKKRAERQVARGWTGRLPRAAGTIHATVRRCIETQRGLGCEAVILPAPLLSDPASDYSSELAWIDAGLQVQSEVDADAPYYVTVAISDSCLRGVDRWASQQLDLVLDQVTARRPRGVYLVIEQANEDGYYISHPNTIGALLRLVRGFKSAGVDRVFV